MISQGKMSTAKWPDELIREPDKRVSDLRVGDAAFLYFTIGLVVTEDRSVYLDPRAITADGPAISCVEVRRDEAGYHVRVPKTATLEPRPNASGRDLIPVQSVTVLDQAAF
jgi:hypothetical protein